MSRALIITSLFATSIALSACRSKEKPLEDLDACVSPGDCLITTEDSCCAPSTCDEAVRVETAARQKKRREICAIKDCSPRRVSPCTTSGAVFSADCRAGHCVVNKTPALSGTWRVVGFHRGDSVSRDPRSKSFITFTATQMIWSGETTIEKTTTAGVQPVTQPWAVAGLTTRAGDLLTIEWPDAALDGSGGEVINAWTTRKGTTSQVRLEFGQPLLFLHRLDTDASLELSPDENP